MGERKKRLFTDNTKLLSNQVDMVAHILSSCFIYKHVSGKLIQFATVCLSKTRERELIYAQSFLIT